MKNKIIFLWVLMLFISGNAGAQTIPQSARDAMSKGEQAVAKAMSPGDYEAAIAAFSEAVKLAPAWPDPYYNLGLVQNEAGHFSDALHNLNMYLSLAPAASDRQAVEDLIRELTPTAAKEESEKYPWKNLATMVNFEGVWLHKVLSTVVSEKVFAKHTLGNDGIKYNEHGSFRLQDNKLEFKNSMVFKTWPRPELSEQVPDWEEWVPVQVNGKFYEFTYHVLSPIYPEKGDKLWTRNTVTVKGEIISMEPLRVREHIIREVDRVWKDYDDTVGKEPRDRIFLDTEIVFEMYDF